MSNEKGYSGVIAGLALAFGMGTESMTKPDSWNRKNWWLVPAVLIIVGYMLQKRGKRVGSVLMALGAYVGYQNYNSRPEAQQSQTADPSWEWITTSNGQQVAMPRGYAAAHYGPAQVGAPPVRTDPAASIARDLYQHAA